MRRNRSHLKPQSYDIPMLNQNVSMLNQNLHFRTSIPSQSEISSPKSLLGGPAHPPKVKYSNVVLKLVIKCIGDTAYDSYIAETLVPLKSTIKPKKQTRFEGNPVTSVRHIPARQNKQPLPKGPLTQQIQTCLSQAPMGICVQDLGAEANDTSKTYTPPSQPCAPLQSQRSHNSESNSIAHFRTNTPSQSEIFSHNNINYKQTDHFRTYAPPQSEISTGTSTSGTSMTGTQTSRRSFTHPTKMRIRWPAVPAAQIIVGPAYPPEVKYSLSTMQAVKQVQGKLQDPPPQSLAI